MNAVLIGLIGVVGTLLGSLTTYYFQSRADERKRADRFRQEELNSCSAFAGALTELKQRLITLWFDARGDPKGAGHQAARIDCDRAGASAEIARFRMQLVSGKPDLMARADSAFDALEPIRRMAFGEDKPVTSASEQDELRELRELRDRELREHETDFESAVKAFIRVARAQLRPTLCRRSGRMTIRLTRRGRR